MGKALHHVGEQFADHRIDRVTRGIGRRYNDSRSVLSGIINDELANDPATLAVTDQVRITNCEWAI
jgi:hypothetical protein